MANRDVVKRQSGFSRAHEPRSARPSVLAVVGVSAETA
jgi:hypothetical protein